MSVRDLSRKQFIRTLTARGFTPLPYLGYWRIPATQGRVCLSELNGGPRLRDRLAYLLREADRHTAPHRAALRDEKGRTSQGHEPGA